MAIRRPATARVDERTIVTPSEEAPLEAVSTLQSLVMSSSHETAVKKGLNMQSDRSSNEGNEGWTQVVDDVEINLYAVLVNRSAPHHPTEKLSQQ